MASMALASAFTPVAAAEETSADYEWTVVSANAAVELKQTATAPKTCHLACTSEGGAKEIWSADTCISTKNQLHFVSNDGEKVVVLEPLPERTGSTWRGASVAFLYHRTQLEKSAVASAMVRDATKIREVTKHFYWLSGALGVPGNPARYREDGSGVDLDAIDGKTRTIRFDGEQFPQPPLPPKKSRKRR